MYMAYRNYPERYEDRNTIMKICYVFLGAKAMITYAPAAIK